jgi:hypothetical protein
MGFSQTHSVGDVVEVRLVGGEDLDVPGAASLMEATAGAVPSEEYLPAHLAHDEVKHAPATSAGKLMPRVERPDRHRSVHPPLLLPQRRVAEGVRAARVRARPEVLQVVEEEVAADGLGRRPHQGILRHPERKEEATEGFRCRARGCRPREEEGVEPVAAVGRTSPP